MCCPLALLWLVGARVTAVLCWLFTGWFGRAFPNGFVAITGIVVVPVTTVWYALVMHAYHGAWGPVPLAGLAIALLVDLSAYRGRRR